jgi:integrase
MSASRDGLVKRCPCPEAKWAKCPHGWTLALMWLGRRHSIALDKHLKAAGDPRRPRTVAEGDAVAAEIRAGIVAIGTYTPPTRSTVQAALSSSTGDTVDTLVARFISEKLERSGKASWRNAASNARRLAATVLGDKRRFGAVPVVDVTEDMIEAVYSATADYRASTRRKYRDTVRRLFAWAVRKGMRENSPITADTELPCEPPAMRSERVRPDVEARLVAAARDGSEGSAVRLEAIIVGAIESGMRRGELLALQWRDVEADAGRLFVRAVEKGARKTKKPRYAPLTPRLLDVLDTLRTSPTGHPFPPSAYVFGDAIGGRVTDIRKAWHTALLKAFGYVPAWKPRGKGLAAVSCAALTTINVHFHDLRHEAALRWHEDGLPLNAIAKLLGHANLSQLQVYLGLGTDDALDAHAALVASRSVPPRGKTTAKLPQTGRSLRLVGGAKRG